MDARVARSLLSIAAVHLALGVGQAGADSSTVDTRRFPNLVRLLLLPEEQALLRELKDERDKVEFQKLFWARRDPTPATTVNELEDRVRADWARADGFFKLPNQRGAETGCGQVLALLGSPELVEGLETRTRFDSLEAARDGSRRAETWTYRERPGQPFKFTRAELRVSFDPECRFDEGGMVLQDLQRVAASQVVRPEIAYRREADGRLAPLAAAAGSAAAGAGASALLTAPREDFPLAAEPKLVMRAQKGEAYAAGLFRASAKGAPGAVMRASVAARAVDASGQPATSAAREVEARAEPDGSFVASWGLSLKPGRYKVTVAALVAEPGKGSTSAIDLEVPDFGAGSLSASPLVLYPDEPAATGAADPRDPYAAMRLGSRRIRPRLGNVFTTTDALVVVAALYGGKPDGATGLASLRARYTILKDGKPVARGAPDAFQTSDAVASVGPIPLASYAPGAYVVRLDVTDEVTKQTLRQEAALEIQAAVAP